MKSNRTLSRSSRFLMTAAFFGSVMLFGPVAAEFQPAQAGIAKKLLRLHNKERSKRNRPKLRKSGSLNRAAQKYAVVMATNSHFSHTGPAPDFSKFDERIRAEGFKKFPVGENIARGQRTAGEVVRGWMRSRGHRKNILKRKFKTVGFGRADAADGPYWVTDFGG